MNPADDLTGKIIAQKYKLLELIGSGGMGTVYKALDLTINRVVALKVLKSETDNEDAVRRFQREATIAARIDSPYCIGILELGIDDGRPYIVMPFIDGKSISEVIKSGALPPLVAVDVFIQICEGLQAAHAKAVVHRDIKPSNVILISQDDSYGVKIVDFGIAKLREPDAQTAPTMTATGEFLGSPMYMSPEQCEGQPADNRSDIYALGILMYETLSGQPPFKDANVLAIIEKHRTSVPEPLYLVDIKKPAAAALQAVVFRCLEKQPEDRYQTTADLKRDLKKVSDQIAGRGTFFIAPFQVQGTLRFLTSAVVKVLVLSFAFLLIASVLFYWTKSSIFLIDSPEKRRIEATLPNQLPALNAEQRDDKDVRAKFRLTEIKNVAGENSDLYLKTCANVGDYFRTHREFEMAMKYYGLEGPVLDKMGLGSSPEAADLFIKQAECCLPTKYALELQTAKLNDSIRILDPLRHVTKDAAVKLIQAIFLKAQCEYFRANQIRLPARERPGLLQSAEFDFNSVLDTYKDTLKQRTELYPSEMATALLETGNYFFDRSRTARDADARERSAKRAIECYRALEEQCFSNEDYAIYEVAALNQIGLTKLILKQPGSAVESFRAALTKLQKMSGPFAKENRTKLRSSLADAYWKSGDYRASALEYFNLVQPDNT